MADRDLDEEVRLAIYEFFVANGRPPVAAELSKSLNSLPSDIEDAYRRLADAHVLVLAPGTPYIWMANPFSALPTPFVVTAKGRDWWANCIWDALGIVALFGAEGSVKSHCPDCGEQIRLEVRGGELVEADGVVHYSVPAANWWDDIGFN